MNFTSARCCGLIFLAAAIAFLAWFRPIDEMAHAHVNADLARALKVFAVARALEAGLSVALSVKVDVAVLEASPAQVLLPVKELVERFAGLMLAASVAFGIQLLLLKIGAHWTVSASLSVLLLLMLAAYWRRNSAPMRLLPALLLFLLVVRFAVPLSAAANALIYAAVMKSEYESAMSVIEQGTDVPAVVPAEAKERKRGVLGAMIDWFDRLTKRVKEAMKDAGGMIDSVVNAANLWADKMVRLLALFALQTIVLPLGSLWLFWRVCKSAVQMLAPARVQA